ncbi:MAG: transposase [Dissulfuribacterales bacterium]
MALVDQKKKKTRNTVLFDVAQCSSCPQCSRCPVKEGKKFFYLRFDDKELRLAIRRKLEKSDLFKNRYRMRSGIEATNSEYDRLTGVKHLRVRGFKAVRFCATIKALGINIYRIAAAMRAGKQSIRPENMLTSPIKALISAFSRKFLPSGAIFRNISECNKIMLVA